MDAEAWDDQGCSRTCATGLANLMRRIPGDRCESMLLNVEMDAERPGAPTTRDLQGGIAPSTRESLATSAAVADIIAMERQSHLGLNAASRPPSTAEVDASSPATGTSAGWMHEVESLLEQIELRLTLLETNHESLMKESQTQTEKLMQDMAMVNESISERHKVHGEATLVDQIINGKQADSGELHGKPADSGELHGKPADSGELQNS
ncbi:hypothetical protein CYMTET_19786 [Cymbomonas tetramitiformis]|uniref:Uncharacterized protein n=1 Tax=Cymbomonas tetramitiformis TaxID=36881 RepID=A0AAE0G5D8_9CHLO|nr:hypothetical protein CYMTET_19786 [Cymbomonas tetramitiformis]